MSRSRSTPGRRPRLLLINPRFKYKHYAAQDELSHLVGKRKMGVPISLLIVAAITPDDYDIQVVDEESDILPIGEPPDVVGITTLSATSERARQIAELYRSMGAHIVMGGPFATFLPDQALEHADTVIIGEAEGAWEEFLRDYEAGKPGQRYQASRRVEGKDFPMPRWDLVDEDHIMTCSVETSRGCPHHCDFCLVHRLFGRKMRYRDIDDVVADIEKLPVKRIFFVADNFTTSKKYARALVRRLQPLGTSWVCQADISVADDTSLLYEMADAGCSGIVIGFESLNPSTLSEMSKGHNKIERFSTAVQRVHAAGIHAMASFIVGYDADDLAEFDRIVEFVEDNNVLFPMLNTLSVAPGTQLFERIKQEGRLHAADAAFRNGTLPCMHYYNFSQREILDKYYETAERMFDYDSVRRRVQRLFANGDFLLEGQEQVGPLEKAAAATGVVRRFLLSKDAAKRRLLLSMMDLVRQGKVAKNTAFFALLSIEGFNQFVVNSQEYLPEVREAVARVDRGPWRDVLEGDRQAS